MEGVVLVAGEGTRLRPLTFTMPKPLIPLLGKPVVQYGIEQMKMLGINRVIFVVGWLGELFKKRFGSGEELGLKIEYVTQEKRLGIAHAIHVAISQGKVNDAFVVYLGDNIIDESWVKVVKETEDFDALIFLTEVPDPRRFGTAIIKDGKVVGFVEKPKVPPSNYALIGLYIFRDPEQYEKCFSTLKPSWRGEYEITDILNCYIKNGWDLKYGIIKGWWKDTGKPDDMIEALIILMDRYVRESRIEGTINGKVVGNVIVEKGATIDGVVYGPAYIGKDVYVSKDAVLEHYVDLESGAKVLSGHVSRTLVLEEAEIDFNDSSIVDSIIGAKSVVKAGKHMKLRAKFVVAQQSLIEFR